MERIRKRWLFKSLVAAVLIGMLYLLLTGDEFLLKPTMGVVAFPIGTLLSWLLLILFSVLCYPLKKDVKSIFRHLSSIALVNALLWGIISYGLAGNWFFRFNNSVEGFRGSTAAFDWFLRYTGFTLLFPILVLFVILVFRLFNNK